MISYDEFSKIELKVATVKDAVRLEGSDKLIKLQIDLGDESRQLVAGIGKKYEPEDLIGRQIVIVANLEPRKLMGEESQGMLLAAHDEEGSPILLVPDKASPSGSKIS